MQSVWDRTSTRSQGCACHLKNMFCRSHGYSCSDPVQRSDGLWIYWVYAPFVRLRDVHQRSGIRDGKLLQHLQAMLAFRIPRGSRTPGPWGAQASTSRRIFCCLLSRNNPSLQWITRARIAVHLRRGRQGPSRRAFAADPAAPGHLA